MKKIVGLILSAVLMVAGLAGCGMQNDYLREDAYDGDKLIIDLFAIDLDCIQAPTADSKAILDVIEDKFQVKFRATTGTQGTWSVLLNQLVGGGDCPDVFFHLKNEPAYSSWVEENYLFDYGEMLDQYPNVKAVFERSSPNLKTFLGGKYFSYPILLRDEYEGSVLSEHAMYYRRDWFEKLRSEGYRPTSGRPLVDPEDEAFNYLNFYDLAEAFTKGDPDGNGKDDTVGYGLNKDSGVYWWYPILSMFNVTAEGWIQQDGKWIPEAITDEMKEAVLFLADMYDRGFINSNYNTTTTMDMMKNDFANGVSGMMVYNATFPAGLGILDLMAKYRQEGQEIFDVVRPMPVVTGKNGKKQILGTTNNYGYLAINNDITANKKKKILDIMEWMLTDEGKLLLDWGIEGTHYEIQNGEKVSLLPLDNNGDQRLLTDMTIAPAAFRLKGLVSWQPMIPQNVRYYEENLALINAWKTDYIYVDELYYVPTPKNMGIKQAELKDMVSTAFKNIVTKINNNAAAARENIWKEFVSTYQSRGTEFITVINEEAKKLV